MKNQFGYILNPKRAQDLSVSSWSERKAKIKKQAPGIAKIARFCPELAIKEKNGKFFVDKNFCKGCGICASLAPELFQLEGE